MKTPAQDIGELVMQSLKKIDKIPYIRYTSVYKRLDEIAEFEVIFEQG